MRSADAVAMIAGTAIGGGLLALPIVTTPMGFLPATVALLSVWCFLVLTAITYAEAGSRVLRDIDPKRLGGGFSVVSLTRCAFGGRVSAACSLAFLAQMLAVMTAQVVKAGEIVALQTSLPHALSCALPSVATGLFAFQAPSRTVERTNTALSIVLLLGFVALVGATLASGLKGGGLALRSAFGAANWAMLVPGKGVGSVWAVPVFLNLLCFGQAVPLIVFGMTKGSLNQARATPSSDESAVAGSLVGPKRSVHDMQMTKVRTALLLGSAIPLVLCVVWAAVSTVLSVALSTSGPMTDPVVQLLSAPIQFALPVAMLAVGAIGTTLLASYLAMGQFITDALCNVKGMCTARDSTLGRCAAVVLPAILACAGPKLYMPLLAFSGAFPTTVLYCLMPPLAALALCRQSISATHAANASSAITTPAASRGDVLIPPPSPPIAGDSPALLPGGRRARRALALAAAALLATSALDVSARLLPPLLARVGCVGRWVGAAA